MSYVIIRCLHLLVSIWPLPTFFYFETRNHTIAITKHSLNASFNLCISYRFVGENQKQNLQQRSVQSADCRERRRETV